MNERCSSALDHGRVGLSASEGHGQAGEGRQESRCREESPFTANSRATRIVGHRACSGTESPYQPYAPSDSINQLWFAAGTFCGGTRFPTVPVGNSELHENITLSAVRHYLRFVLSAVHLWVAVVFAGFKSRAALQVENLACPWRIPKSCGDWSLIQP